MFAHATRAQENSKVLDRIVAVVNDHIILKSEVDSRVAQYLQGAQQQGNSNVQFSKDLWYSALESVVDKYVLLEKAKIDSITVSDEQVNQAMDQRIDQLVQRAGSEEQLEKALGKSLIQIKADFREQFREDMIVQKIRQQKQNEITITRPEVQDYFDQIPQDSIPTVPERVSLSQIVAIPPPKKDAESSARQLAEQIRDSIMTGKKDFATMARKYSDGPSASNGGHIGLYNVKDLVPEYSAAASALQPGEISEVVKTKYGYHIIRLNKRVGDKVDTDQILIKIEDNQLDDQTAIDKLNAIRDSVLTDSVEFSDMARKYSDDKATANMGGKILAPQSGERLIPLNRLDPALYRIALLLENEGDISKPKSYTPQSNSSSKAYRIVRLDQRIPEHEANLDQDYDLIKRYALQQKQMKQMQKWISKLRDQVYVKFKIPVPTKAETLKQRQS